MIDFADLILALAEWRGRRIEIESHPTEVTEQEHQGLLRIEARILSVLAKIETKMASA